MKIKKCLFMLAFALLFAVCGGAAFAQSEEYHNVWDDIPHSEIDIEGRNFGHLHLQRLDEPPADINTRKIMSYDVSENGNIMILFSDCLIAVYDNDFNFIYAISFSLSEYHSAMWYGDNVALMPWRGVYALVLDENASPIAMYDLKASEFECKDIATSRTRVHGGYTYFLHNRNESDFMIEYSMITKGRHILERTDANGNTEILFESPVKLSETLFKILFIPFFIALCIISAVIIRKIKGVPSNEGYHVDSNYRSLGKK